MRKLCSSKRLTHQQFESSSVKCSAVTGKLFMQTLPIAKCGRGVGRRGPLS